VKLLVIFLDGFHPDYLKHPRAKALADLAARSAVSEMEPVLGFSNANKVSLFTGTAPDVHEQWSYFQYAPDKSPFKTAATQAFRWIDHVPGELPRKGLKFALSKTYVARYGRARGYPKLSWENVPIGLLENFDHTERDLLKGVGVPSLFSIATAHGHRCAWVDVPWYPKDRHLAKLEHAIRENDVVVMYNANMDAAGHWFAPEAGSKFDAWLERTDALVARALGWAREHWGSAFETMLVSDHGMASTMRHVNLPKILKSIPGHGRDFIPFIDSTMARFWFHTDSAKRRVEDAMAAVGNGRFLDESDRRALGVDFAHRGYGDAIYLLEPTTAFYPAYVSWVKPRGMHGYDPRHPTQTAAFLTTGRTPSPRVRSTTLLNDMLHSIGIREHPPPTRGGATALTGERHAHACAACGGH